MRVGDVSFHRAVRYTGTDLGPDPCWLVFGDWARADEH